MKVSSGLLTFWSVVSAPIAVTNAANYGGFGSTYAEVINPKDAVVNTETVKSPEVGEGLAGIQSYIKVVKTLKEDLVGIDCYFCYLLIVSLDIRRKIHNLSFQVESNLILESVRYVTR